MAEPGKKLSRQGGAAAETISALLCVWGALAAVMLFTGYWPLRPNEYNTYTLQACAWLAGRLDIGRDYDYLELAVYGGKYYASFPPFPSYVLLPLALLFGENTPDALLSLAVTGLGVVYALRLYRGVCDDGRGVFWTGFLYLGTGYVFIAVNGYVWFLAQTMCFTLSLMALEHARRGQGGAALTLWACGVGCRPLVLLYLPILLRLAWPAGKSPGKQLMRRWYWCLGPLLLGGSYMLLNALRFGDPLEFGHNYLPEFTRAPLGQFSLGYLKENLYRLFRLPRWNGWDRPATICTADGMAFWLVDPLFIAGAAAWAEGLRDGRRENALLLPVLTAGYGFVLCCHRTLGGWHFGCRYLLDVTPWLYFGLLRWKRPGGRLEALCLPLMGFGGALNLIGTAALYNHWL